jgi:hypothetical protein
MINGLETKPTLPVPHLKTIGIDCVAHSLDTRQRLGFAVQGGKAASKPSFGGPSASVRSGHASQPKRLLSQPPQFPASSGISDVTTGICSESTRYPLLWLLRWPRQESQFRSSFLASRLASRPASSSIIVSYELWSFASVSQQGKRRGRRCDATVGRRARASNLDIELGFGCNRFSLYWRPSARARSRLDILATTLLTTKMRFQLSGT